MKGVGGQQADDLAPSHYSGSNARSGVHRAAGDKILNQS